MLVKYVHKFDENWPTQCEIVHVIRYRTGHRPLDSFFLNNECSKHVANDL